MQQKLQAICEMQMLMGKETLSPHQLIIVAVHAINNYHKLKCLTDTGEQCEFPQNWKQTTNGTYVFKYRNTSKGGIVNFKFTIAEDKVVVAFGYEGSKEINKVTFDKNDSSETIVKYYEFNLKQFLASQPPVNRPVFQSNNLRVNNTYPENNSFQNSQQANFVSNVQGIYPPRNMVNSPQMINPFGQEEYVGPNSQIFNNPYYTQARVPNNSMIPPGARYDPIDPFDDPLRVPHNGPNDFVGFDQFGAPINPNKPKRTSLNPNFPGFGGFGGGFGGNSRGGFGGGFGPVI